jgi:hypothetical protein
MARQFLTVADELLEHAECVADFLEGRGFTVKAEHTELGFPYAPTIHARRKPTTLLVEVAGGIPTVRLTAWARYAKSRGQDTRIAVALPRDLPRPPEDDTTLRETGIGLYVSDGTMAEEVITAKDMAVSVELPELKTLPPPMRRVLGPAYDKFDHSHWREGFEDACQTVEAVSRKYLDDGIKSGRIVLVTEKGNVRKPLTTAQVEKLTMGQLAVSFSQIQKQNHADATIRKVLTLLKNDRNAVVHHKAKRTTETRLRKNVGQHMWIVVAALKELLGTK